MFLVCAFSFCLSMALANKTIPSTITLNTSARILDDSTFVFTPSSKRELLETNTTSAGESTSSSAILSSAVADESSLLNQLEKDNSSNTSALSKDGNYTTISTTKKEDNSSTFKEVTKNNYLTRNCSTDSTLTCQGSFCESQEFADCLLEPLGESAK